MNIEFLKTKKIFQKKEYKVNVGVYWKAVLGVVFIIIVLSFFYGVNLFLDINKDPIVSSASVSGQVEKNRKIRIDKILEYFSQKEKDSERILTSPSPVVDPSL